MERLIYDGAPAAYNHVEVAEHLHDALRLCLSPDLFRVYIIDKSFHCTVLADESLDSFVTVTLLLYWLIFNKEFFAAEYLYILLCVY